MTMLIFNRILNRKISNKYQANPVKKNNLWFFLIENFLKINKNKRKRVIIVKSILYFNNL